MWKTHSGNVEIIDRLDKTNTAYLKQVIRVFSPIPEPLDDA